MREHVLTVLQGIVAPGSILTGKSLTVITPANADEISKIMRLANQEAIKVLTPGSKCDPGDSLAAEDTLMLSLEKMNTIIEMDTANLVATVEPGVTVTQLNQDLKQYGLFYPLDPGRGENATFGEIVAQNANGLRGLKYGATKHYIMGLDVILADGRLLKTGGKNVKDVAGYDMTKLMTGSANTLGTISSITVKLMPAPEQQKLLIASFGSTADAGKAISAVFSAKVVPSAAEILNSDAVKALSDAGYSNLPAAAAVLMIELDGIPAAVEKAGSKVADILRACNVQQVLQVETAQDAVDYWASRQAISSVFAANASASLDVTIPRSRLSEALEMIEATAGRYDTAIAVFGHAGEGNLFPAIMQNGKADLSKLAPVQEELIQSLHALGASVNGTARQLEMQYGPLGMSAMQQVKKTFDPNCTLNPGKLVGVC